MDINKFYNIDCIEGTKKFIPDNSIDLIITDPPYGIDGDKLHKHYNRKEDYVIDGYVEVPSSEYSEFSIQWIKEAERILKPGGSIYIISGYTNLIHILNALKLTSLNEINHIIWKYNFGVYTEKKFISSHYHILYYSKPGAKRYFNTYAFYSDFEKDEKGGSLNYQDREDVWIINREYKPGKIKNKNELPTKLLAKMILYSSRENDLVCDLFLGSFSTAKVAIGLNRRACGFEINQKAFDYQIKETEKIQIGELLPIFTNNLKNRLVNKGKPLNKEIIDEIVDNYNKLKLSGLTKKQIIDTLSSQFGRGFWSISKIINDESNQLKQIYRDQLF